MLPGYVAGHYGYDEVHIDLRPLCQFAGARLFNDEVVELDLEGRRAICRNRPPVRYDLLSINVGSEPTTRAVPGAEQFAVPVKPISRFAAHWEGVRERVISREGQGRIGVIGGGAGGVELILSVRHALQKALGEWGMPDDGLAFHLVTEEDDILTGHNRAVARRLRAVMADRNVKPHFNFRVVEVREGEVLNAEGTSLPLDEILMGHPCGTGQMDRPGRARCG